MPRVQPFAGLRYDSQRIDLAAVLAPPYDVIGRELQESLYGRALQNVVRVELGKDFPNDVPGKVDRYTRARDHLSAWLEQGFLVRDDRPGVYVHEHTFEAPGAARPRRRLGAFVGVEPVAHSRRQVLRHELTLDRPKEDRIKLLQATGVQTSPLLLLHDAGPEVDAELDRQVAVAPLCGEAEVPGEYGRDRHRLWRVTDEAAVALICGGLGASQLFIADGHHRYETALALRLPLVLALVAPLRQSDHVILATHRIVEPSPMAADELLTALSGAGWDVTTWPERDLAQLKVRELAADHHAFVILDADTIGTASRRRQQSQKGAAGLDVAVLNREILEAVLRIGPKDAAAGRIRYSRDPAEAAQAAARRGVVAFLLNPTPLEAVTEAARAGEVLPQKSTYFFPKVPTGLVMMETP
ncbi:MAG: DUF1015 domain-containing protein [Candidatus Dormiibacterota bacterium]